MYESPIEIIYDDIKMHFENEILNAIQHYDIQVDKDELIRALRYDRDQYEKGFKDGAEQKAKWIPINETLPSVGTYLVSGGGKVWIADFKIFNDIMVGFANPAQNPVIEAWMPLPKPYKEAENEQHTD